MNNTAKIILASVLGLLALGVVLWHWGFFSPNLGQGEVANMVCPKCGHAEAVGFDQVIEKGHLVSAETNGGWYYPCAKCGTLMPASKAAQVSAGKP